MKQFFITIFILILGFQIVSGQESPEVSYQPKQKSQATAVLLSFLISSTGHAYAGNWGRGLAFTAGRVGCAVLMFTAGIKETTETDHGYYYTTITIKEEKTPFFYIGAGGAIILSIWEMVDAAKEVKRYNNRYSGNPKFGLDLVPERDGASIKLSYNF